MGKDAACSAALYPSSDTLLPCWKAGLSDLYLCALILAWPEPLEGRAALAPPFPVTPGWWCSWGAGLPVLTGREWCRRGAPGSPSPGHSKYMWGWLLSAPALVLCHSRASTAAPDGPSAACAEPTVMVTQYRTPLQHQGAVFLAVEPRHDVEVAQELSSSSAPSPNAAGKAGMCHMWAQFLSTMANHPCTAVGPHTTCGFGSFFNSTQKLFCSLAGLGTVWLPL